MEFDLEQYHDGGRDKYGSEYNMDIDWAVEELIYYNDISNKYSEEELYDMLEEMRLGDNVMIYGNLVDYKITRSK